MGFVDAFVFAHHHHRRNIDDPGNFGDCMKGRIGCMTAITPANAHAYQLICLTRHFPVVPSQKCSSVGCHLTYLRTTTRERGNDFQGWTIYTDGSTRLADGETFAGWGAVARSHHGRTDVMFGPDITEISATVEALSFLGPPGPVARDALSCVFYESKHAAGGGLGTILARTHAHLGLSCQQLLQKVQHRLRFSMQQIYSHAENLGNECADHAAPLGAFGLVSNRDLSTRWARHSFDSASCFATCQNLGDVLEKVT